MAVVGRTKGRGLRVALWVAAICVVLLVASQLLLPRLAVHTVRQRVGRYGPVLSAHVSAFPALELLWGHAQSASVSTGPLRMTQAQATGLLQDARGIDSLDLSATSLVMEPLRLEHVKPRLLG